MEVHIKPEKVEFLRGRVDAGIYSSTDEALDAAIELLEQQEFPETDPNATGADLIAAMQACPYPDFDFEFPGVRSPVREPEF